MIKRMSCWTKTTQEVTDDLTLERTLFQQLANFKDIKKIYQ